ncbi:streptococcal hemagglutinin [Drosophila tropicalis]|uniref:streptococcal hemagglutinin n=1 Tax=Drosophila tropicalis TaxID=46794 RepID=UPI0035ABC58D
MFSPFKKIFTYIQKNASSSNMFGQTTIATTSSAPATSRLSGDEESVGSDGDRRLEKPLQQEPQIEEEEEDDIERQIKTSIIDASKVKSLPIQLDDELADFAHDPVEQHHQQQQLHLEDDQLEEEFLELDDFPNNEIIVIDTDLNSSLASDNVSEDPLAIDTILDSSSVTTNDEVDTSSDILWLKINHQETTNAANAHQTETNRQTDELRANPAEPPKQTKTKEEELRSSDGGSDSGLGSETSIIKETTTTTTSSSTNSPIKPIRSNLKRRLEVEDSIDLAIPDIASSSSSSQATPQAQKRPKRCINFDNVKVYYFPRQQGFSCVPTAGGCTLGMGARHIAFKTMTLAEHAAELRRAHRNQNQDLQTRGSSTDDSEESEEDYLSESSSSDPDDGSNGFLQPVTPKQRRALLKAAGVRKIDASEKSDCRDIRNSREVCGCSCREFCDPETCACSQAGIKCQVDRAMFPCGCSREACGNTVGRVEFNPTRVRTHYIHTVMRLDLEQRQGVQQQQLQLQQQSNSYTNGGANGATQSAATSPHCYFMQTQSNYSSGYASPAYTPDSSVSYYQQQQQQQQIVAVNSPGNSAIQQQNQYSGYTQLDSLDSGLFGSNSNGTPAYGELYQSLSYGNAQMTSYQTVSYQHTSSPAVAAATAGAVAANSPAGTPSAFRSCSVPSAPPFGNATTTASSTNSQYQTTASMTAASTTTNGSCSPRLGGNSVASIAASAASSPAEFISLNSPIASSSRLSQINDLLQHNRNTTAALVAVSEGYGGVRISSISSSSSTLAATNIDSIETPPIVEDAQHRSCMTFEELPPPLINPTPIVTVVETKLPEISAVGAATAQQSSLAPNIQGPQPRQPLDVQSLTETT